MQIEINMTITLDDLPDHVVEECYRQVIEEMDRDEIAEISGVREYIRDNKEHELENALLDLYTREDLAKMIL